MFWPSFWQLDCWFLGVDKVSWKFSEQLVLVEGKKSGSLSMFKSFKMIEFGQILATSHDLTPNGGEK